MFLQYVDSDKHKILLGDFHNEASGDHYSSIVTSFKILRNGYYYPRMFKYVYKWVGQCDKCKMFKGKPQLVALPLRHVVIEEPFNQWGMDFVGPLNTSSSVVHTHILTAMDYFTKWVKVVPIKKTTSKVRKHLGRVQSHKKNSS